jgi:hypothetical protein
MKTGEEGSFEESDMDAAGLFFAVRACSRNASDRKDGRNCGQKKTLARVRCEGLRSNKTIT